LAQTDGDSVLTLNPPVASRPYLDLTAEVAAAFGMTWVTTPHEGGLRFHIGGGQRPRCARFVVEGDWSGAAFPLVAAAVRGRPLRLTGVRAESSQGDRALVDILRRFGLALTWEEDTLVMEPAPLTAPGDIDLESTPDLFPALCALATMTPGETTLGGAPSLRHKECDRIAAMARGLARLGVRVTEHSDGLTVSGGTLRSAELESYGDHRVHMSFALLDGVGGVTIGVDHPHCVAVSYPDFHRDLAAISLAP
jgi:3-phosphoshikimate 1-carboxyvinyltransferase